VVFQPRKGEINIFEKAHILSPKEKQQQKQVEDRK
jgi:hypothetical protein